MTKYGAQAAHRKCNAMWKVANETNKLKIINWMWTV